MALLKGLVGIHQQYVCSFCMAEIEQGAMKYGRAKGRFTPKRCSTSDSEKELIVLYLLRSARPW